MMGCSKWEYVNVSNMFSARWGVHGIQISENEVIVFGGSDYSHSSKMECYVLRMMGDVSCKRLCDLVEGSAFNECASPVFDGSYVYGSDNNRRLHIYSVANGEWEMIE